MSLFKQPSWQQNARPAERDGDREADDSQDSGSDEDNLFRHSNSFRSIVADSEKQRKAREEEKRRQKEREEVRRARKQQEQDARLKRTSTGEGNDDEAEGGAQTGLKKRRITAEDSAALLVSVGVSSPLVASARKDSVRKVLGDDEEESEAEQSPAKRLPNRQQPVGRRRGNADKPPVRPDAGAQTAESSDDDIQFVRAVTHEKPIPPRAKPPPVELDEDSDPEIAALARTARARAAEARQKENLTAPTTSGPSAAATTITAASEDPAGPPDAKISILITSPIEGTEPLLVIRRLSQRLQEVRQAWCERQPFSPEFAKSIVLVFRERRRLWDVTTCRSLGLQADERGNVTLREDPSKTGVDQVHLEAMTEEMFEALRAAKARQALAEETAALAPGDDLDENANAEESELEESPPPAAREEYIRITIKAKSMPDFKAKVTTDTVIKKIIKAAKRHYKLAADQPVYLDFDGERLEPDAKVSDTEIEDEVCLELFLGE